MQKFPNKIGCFFFIHSVSTIRSLKHSSTRSHCFINVFHLLYLFHFCSRANIILFPPAPLQNAHRLLDTCAWQMKSELSLTASFIPDGLNYFITINDTPSASCAVLPDVQRPQSHSASLTASDKLSSEGRSLGAGA